MADTDYFSAAGDAAALGDGPESAGPWGRGLPTVSAKMIDPAVCIGLLEAFLTGRSYAEVKALPRQGKALNPPTGDEDFGGVVVAVTDSLRDALAAADDERLLAVARRWVTIEELAGHDPDFLTAFVRDLAGLARGAGEGRLYCYWSM